MTDIDKITQALELLRMHIDTVPPEIQQAMRDAVAGWVLGADVPAQHMAQALVTLRQNMSL